MVRESNGICLSVDENGKSDSFVINKKLRQKLPVDVVDENFEIKLWVTRAKAIAEVKKEKEDVIKYNGKLFKAIEPEDDDKEEEREETSEEQGVNTVFAGQF